MGDDRAHWVCGDCAGWPRPEVALRTVATCALLAVCFVPVAAMAQPDGDDIDYSGSWTAGATRVQVQVASWGSDCGPQPRSTTVPAAGRVSIARAGDHLVIQGQQDLRTDGCWSDNQAVTVVSSTHRDGYWRTVCRTAPSDGRRETGTYTLRADGPDRLVFNDVSSFDWQLRESRCAFEMRRTQTFSRVNASADPAPTPACTPGEPANLQLTPREAELEPGGRVRFRASVRDRAGCAIRGARIEWQLERPAGRVAELRSGVFRAGDTAAEAEGTFRVRVSSGSLSAQATVEVRTPDLSDLIARRTSGGIVLASEEAVVEDAVGVRAAQTRTEPVAPVWPFVVGGVVAFFMLVGVAIVVLRRRSSGMPAADEEPLSARVAPSADRSADTEPAPEGALSERPPVALVCPVCHGEHDDPKVTFCPKDGAQLHPRGEAGPGQAMICPACRRGYAAGTKLCATDSEELVPYSLFLERARRADDSEKRICPVCGTGYGAQVRFCGRDGTELVRVN